MDLFQFHLLYMICRCHTISQQQMAVLITKHNNANAISKLALTGKTHKPTRLPQSTLCSF